MADGISPIHIDGSDKEFRRLIKAHNRAIQREDRAKPKSQRRKLDHFETKPLRARDLFRKGRVRADDIRQSQIGNCYLLAALKSIAQRNPQLIEEMIAQRPDGTVVVRLYDKKITDDGTVSYSPVDYHLDKSVIFSEKMNTHRAGWVYLFEKAYMLHRLRHNDNVTDRPWTAASIMKSGQSSEAFEYLLGIEAERGQIELPTHPLNTIRLEASTFDLYEQHEESRPGIINNLYLADPDIRNAWKQLISNEEILNIVLNEFPSDHYGKLHRLLTSIKESPAGDLDNRLRGIQELWPTLTEQQVYIVLIGLQKADYIHKNKQLTPIREKITRSLKQGELVCVGGATEETRQPGIVSNHAYHLINIYQRGENWYALLENPWGSGVPGLRFHEAIGSITNPAVEFEENEFARLKNDGGIFELPLENFIQIYKNVYTTKLEDSSALLEERVADAGNQLNQEIEKQKKFLKIQALVDNPALLSQEDRTKSVEHINNQLICIEYEIKRLEAPEKERDQDEDTLLKMLHNQREKLTKQLNSVEFYQITDEGYVDSFSENAITPDQIRELTRAQDNVIVDAYNKREDEAQYHQRTSHLQHGARRNHDSEQASNNNASRPENTPLAIIRNKLINYLALDTRTHSTQSRTTPIDSLRYRLFYRGADRMISKERKQRANVAIAMIDTWKRVNNTDDQATLLGMLQALKQHHDNHTSLGNRFHGNRLGKILKDLKFEQPKRGYKPLSHEAERLLRDALFDRHIDPNLSGNSFLNEMRFQKDTMETASDALSHRLSR